MRKEIVLWQKEKVSDGFRFRFTHKGSGFVCIIPVTGLKVINGILKSMVLREAREIFEKQLSRDIILLEENHEKPNKSKD